MSEKLVVAVVYHIRSQSDNYGCWKELDCGRKANVEQRKDGQARKPDRRPEQNSILCLGRDNRVWPTYGTVASS